MLSLGKEIPAASPGGVKAGGVAGSLVPALMILFLGGVVQGLTYLNHDVAWVLDSSQRLLRGGTFGREIVAANPPLIWWLSAAVEWLASVIGAEPIVTLRLAVLALAATALVNVDRAYADRLDRLARGLLLSILALIFVFFVHRDFGQREHLAVLLCTPWLMVMSRRADNAKVEPIPAAIAGIATGIGIAFKPYFLAVLAMVWLSAALRRRSLGAVLTAETLAIVLTGATYLFAVWVFARPYLTDVVPLISQTYWGFAFPLSGVIEARLAIISLCGVAIAASAISDIHSGGRITAAAAAGFLIAALLQSKGYTYHFYPVLALSLISLALVAFTADAKRKCQIAAVLLCSGLVLATLQAVPALIYRSAAGAYGSVTACLVEMVEANVPTNGGFMALSTHPYPGFPVANYAHRRWVAASNSRLFLPAIARLRAKSMLSAHEKSLLVRAIAAERSAILKDMMHKPDLVFVDAQRSRHAIGTIPMDFVAFYMEDPIFARIWARYREIPSCVPSIHAFLRIRGN